MTQWSKANVKLKTTIEKLRICEYSGVIDILKGNGTTTKKKHCYIAKRLLGEERIEKNSRKEL